MNRRGFVKSLGAALAVPALPAQSLMASAGAAAPAAVPHGLYMWGKMLTEVHGHCSTGMLTSMLKVEPKVALGIYDALLTNGVVAPANALGLSQATNPLHAPMPHASARTISTTRLQRPKLDDLLQDECAEPDEVLDTSEIDEDLASIDPVDSSDVNQEAVSSDHEPDESLSQQRSPDHRSGSA